MFNFIDDTIDDTIDNTIDNSQLYFISLWTVG